MKNIFILTSFVFLIACSSSELQMELEKTRDELELVEAALAKSQEKLMKMEEDQAAPFTHLVFFDLKPEADQKILINAIHKLKAIPEVHQLEVGTFEDTGDQRALSSYALLMKMSFRDSADYAIYQAHPLHLELKASARNLMAGPPATYDYMEQ